MAKRWSILAISSCVLLSATAAATQDVNYAISLLDQERHLVQITMKIPPGQRSHELQLPVWNALYQIRDFSQYIDWIRAESPSRQPLPLTQIDKSRWKLDGTMQGAVLSYQIFADNPGPFGAQLNTHHAFFNLAEILIYPVDLRSAPSRVEFQNVPSGWNIATSLEKQSDAYFAENYDRLVDSPVEISDFTEQDFAGTCGRYRVVFDRESLNQMAGPQPKQILAAIVPQLQRIVDAASAWMNDCPFQNYMFIYHASDPPADGGMEHAYSTAITLPSGDFENVSSRLLSTTSHEFFHLWNVKRIRPQSLEPVDYTKENYTTALWFSEGVDSTVGEYILLHAGLLDEQHYVEHLSREITELENRPAHLTQSVEQSSLDAWLEKYPYYGLPDRSISYYNKGELLGVLLDLAMRSATDDRESLRDLFRWMDEHYARQNRFFDDSTGVRDAAETLSHADLRDFFTRYVAGTDEIPWDKLFASVGLRVERDQVSVADAGFASVQEFDQPPIVVAIPGRDAAQAGLRAGDAILNVNGEAVARNVEAIIAQLTPRETIRVTVRRDGLERTLEWKLGSRIEIGFQLRDVPGITAKQRQSREAWLFDRGVNHHR